MDAKTNTPEVKTYTWEELILRPGLYSSIEFKSDYLILVLEKKYDTDEWPAEYGLYDQPEVILCYHRELKSFMHLPNCHLWYKYTFIKVPETIIIR